MENLIFIPIKDYNPRVGLMSQILIVCDEALGKDVKVLDVSDLNIFGLMLYLIQNGR